MDQPPLFPVGEEKPLRAKQPLQLGLTADEGVVEIIGWGIQVDLRDKQDLPRHVGQRFLELFTKSIQGELNEIEEACFAKICEQVDYRQFSQSREMPRYREATLVRNPKGVSLEFISEKINLSDKLANQLRVLKNNQRFGAWFTVDSKGETVAIKAVTPLKPIDDAAEALSDIPPVTNDKVPEFIREKLNRKRDGEN